MANDTNKMTQSILSPFPLQKSKVAFLVEGLDALGSTDKPYHVEEWDFSTVNVVAVNKTLKVSFKSTNQEHVKGIQDTLYKLYHHSKQTQTLPLSVSMMNRHKFSLQHVANCLGDTYWRSLDNPRKLKSFLRQLRELKLTVGVIYPIIGVLKKLSSLGVIETFIESKALLKCAKPKDKEQSVAIPSKMFQGMLNHSLRVVEKYYEHRHEISRVMKEAYDLKERIVNGEVIQKSSRAKFLADSPKAIDKRFARAVKRISHNIPDFTVNLKAQSLSEILTNCVVVILAFSGARIGEALSFNKDSIKPITINGKRVILLQGETTKGNDGIPRVVTWQSHPIAQVALELAYDMMESTRTLYAARVDEKEKQGLSPESIKHMRKQLKSAFLVPTAVHQDSDNYVFYVFKHLQNLMNKWFAYKATQEDLDEFEQLNPAREGQLKLGGTYSKISSHDFRRTFAVLFVRYGFGSASGIKFQYKHANINMSDYYANNAYLARMNDILLDEELLDELSEEGIELGVDLFDDVYNGSEHLSGAQGDVIKQERLRVLESGQSILMTREEIEEHIRSGDFHIIQLPSGAYCTNASCDRVCGTQPFRAEVKECAHKVVTDRGAKKIAKQRERLIAKFRAINTGDKLKSSILAGLKQKIQIEELTLKKHSVAFAPFKDEIMV
jgi:integrase